MNNNNKGMAYIFAVIALIIGGVFGYSMGNKNTKTTVSQSGSTGVTEKASDLRVLLNGLEQEHVALASAATRAGFDGVPSFKAAAGSLDKNSRDLASAVGSVYGKDAESKFYEIWNSHIGFFVDYTVAAKKGDKAGMDKAVENLNGYVEAISTFFSSANPNLPKAAVAQLITDHVGLLKGAVDTYGANDLEGSYEKQREARAQIVKIADAISGAIVKQYPAKF